MKITQKLIKKVKKGIPLKNYTTHTPLSYAITAIEIALENLRLHIDDVSFARALSEIQKEAQKIYNGLSEEFLNNN